MYTFVIWYMCNDNTFSKNIFLFTLVLIKKNYNRLNLQTTERVNIYLAIAIMLHYV